MIRIAVILLLAVSMLRAEDSMLDGGKSPDGRYEVRIYQSDKRDPSDYYYGVVDHKTKRLLRKLDQGGGFSRYADARETSKVLWHNSNRFFALTDHGTRHSMEMYLFGITSEGKLVLIEQPDYFQNALGRVSSTEGYLTAVVQPIEWKGDELNCNLFFDAKTPDSPRAMYSVDFTLQLRDDAMQSPGLRFKWMGTPKQEE